MANQTRDKGEANSRPTITATTDVSGAIIVGRVSRILPCFSTERIIFNWEKGEKNDVNENKESGGSDRM